MRPKILAALLVLVLLLGMSGCADNVEAGKNLESEAPVSENEPDPNANIEAEASVDAEAEPADNKRYAPITMDLGFEIPGNITGLTDVENLELEDFIYDEVRQVVEVFCEAILNSSYRDVITAIELEAVESNLYPNIDDRPHWDEDDQEIYYETPDDKLEIVVSYIIHTNDASYSKLRCFFHIWVTDFSDPTNRYVHYLGAQINSADAIHYADERSLDIACYYYFLSSIEEMGLHLNYHDGYAISDRYYNINTHEWSNRYEDVESNYIEGSPGQEATSGGSSVAGTKVDRSTITRNCESQIDQWIVSANKGISEANDQFASNYSMNYDHSYKEVAGTNNIECSGTASLSRKGGNRSNYDGFFKLGFRFVFDGTTGNLTSGSIE